MKKNVFILGVTGYIGGAVLVRTRRSFPTWRYTALVRSEANFDAVRAAGVDEIIHGSHADLDKIRDAASKSDVVLNLADADDLDLTKAVLDGLAKSKGDRILVHTSGTGVVSDKAEGEFTEYAKKIWNDNSEDDIRSIDPAQPHRDVDLTIFAADTTKKVSAYIIAPSSIYGTSSGPVHRISQQVPNVVRASVTLRTNLYVGKGTNVWNNVHIDDLAELYDIVLRRALSGADAKAASVAKFYFASVREHVWGDVDRAIGAILYDKGLVDNKEAVSVPFAVVARDAPLLKYAANNSRSKSERGFNAGWKPVAPTLEETLRQDVEDTLKGW